ncbi:hypothetical protein QBC38DRAFT_459213 [Podospora fimiseda]|uniref:Uncharacterized protein n=1 Tax=Podospora fimiseda TaxID=252190 RepID=A0AAN7BHK3_9PEZI|nr:hypothetical protein QBC38DRAFT_459213 [Podospora fimiseda]
MQPSSKTLGQALCTYRQDAENLHRFNLYRWLSEFRPSVNDLASLSTTRNFCFPDLCNKSFPLYVLPGNKPLGPLPLVLHNYIYHRWFRPYRSEIEDDRFIVKQIWPRDLQYEEKPSQSTFETLKELNIGICAAVEERRPQWDARLGVDPASHILQPLFRALLVVVAPALYQDQRLSGPITFDSIRKWVDPSLDTADMVRTDFETAMDFCIELENREAAAFGLQPDPVATWKRQNYRLARDFLEGAGDEWVPGATSRFVDRDDFPTDELDYAKKALCAWIGQDNLMARREWSRFEVMKIERNGEMERAIKSEIKPCVVVLRCGTILHL